MIVIEFEGRDASGVGLESEDEDIAHESHVFGDILWDSIGGSIDIGFIKGWFPALEFASFSGVCDTLFDIAHRVEVFIEFALIATADLTADISGVFEDGIKDALVRAMVFVFEEAVEGECGVEFERSGCCWARPGDVRAIDHRVIFMD